MNEIAKITNGIAICERQQIAKQIMTVCSAITPAFWRNKSTQELQAEKLSIELLTSNIQNECLAKMCELAIKNYPKDRSQNDKTFFDINYIMKFYTIAFNQLYCYSIDKNILRERIAVNYDVETGILKETWRTKNDEIIYISYIGQGEQPKASPVYYESLFDSIGDGL